MKAATTSQAARTVSALVIVSMAVTLVAPEASAASARTRRVSVSSNEAQGNLSSFAPALSASGRWLAFESDATNLVGNDTAGQTDIFVRDRDATTTRRVSLRSNGVQGNDWSVLPAISGNGRFVAFESRASNLVANDTNGEPDVFVHDRRTRRTTRVSVSSSGTQGDGSSCCMSISSDGRFVAFLSDATNLVANDTNAEPDVFVHDRRTGKTRRVSRSSAGVQGDGGSEAPDISASGRFVTFESRASNLVASDTNGTGDVFVHDRRTGRTSRVSLGPGGAEGAASSRGPTISADGRYVAFESFAANLVAADTNGHADIFVRDREKRRTTLVSRHSDGDQGNGSSGQADISGSGRWVAFSSGASDLVALDTNGDIDIFVTDRRTGRTRRVSIGPNGRQANDESSHPAISADGRYVGFESDASNLVANDTNDAQDIFVRGPLH